MRPRFKTMRVATVALLAATCLSSGVALSQQRVFVFWPNREPMKMGIQAPVEEQEPLDIELSLPTPFGLTVGQPVALAVATQGDTDGVTYRTAAAASMPGLTVNASNGSISGVPSAPAGTTYSIAVEAVRSGTVVGTTPPISKVLRAAIEIDLVPDDIELAAGEPFPSGGIVAGATGGDQDTITWSLKNAPEWLDVATVAPGGAMLQQATGTDIDETPAATVTLVAADAEGRQDTDTFNVEVSTASIALNVPSPFGLTTGQPVSLTLEGVNGLDGIEYVAAGDAAMEGLTVNPTTGAVTGTPNGPAGTVYHIAVDAVRSNAVIASASVDRTLRDPLAITTIPSGLELTAGETLPTDGMEVAVSGGDQASISWSLEGAPAWLTVEETEDGTSVLTRAEGENVSETEATTVTVTARDSEGRETSADFTVKVDPAPMKLDKISTGNEYSCGITDTDDAYCWGKNNDGQLGNGSTASTDIPVLVSGDLAFLEIANGRAHTCGITNTGDAYCWGNGSDGQLGNDSTADSNIPVAVSGDLSFTKISAGANHTCGITATGETYCWGRNYYGQLGNGAGKVDSRVPVPVSGGHSFVEISTGDFYSCGITGSGKAYCWGNGGSGQIGNGAKANSDVPVAVSGGLSFTKISTGDYYSCGITHTGETYCWGSNGNGELGNGGTNNLDIPTLVAGDHSFTDISAGYAHTCGITGTGKAYCWGDGEGGKLGNGSTADSHVPAPVAGDHSFAEIAPGTFHTCGITDTGGTYCWGYNSSGQLGADVGHVYVYVPVAVVNVE